ncbi:MAG: cytochrome c [Gammaproteobacteria bacterium]|jgi:cytochrome c556|nr:cytochrome c [Gammaproteobacteria bacterium]
MPKLTQTLFISGALVAGLALSPLAVSHFNDKEVMQSYRQSWFAMVATNFGPMVSMLKGEMPWDDARMQAAADQLAQLTAMDISRGFSPGTEKGTTRAKPEIWENMEDFSAKMDDLRSTSAALQTAAASGDRKAIGKAVGDVGQSCKACHDEYKSEDYLY